MCSFLYSWKDFCSYKNGCKLIYKETSDHFSRVLYFSEWPRSDPVAEIKNCFPDSIISHLNYRNSLLTGPLYTNYILEAQSHLAGKVFLNHKSDCITLS